MRAPGCPRAGGFETLACARSSTTGGDGPASVAPAHREHLEGRCKRDAEALPVPRAKPSRNSRGSQFSQPSPSMYAACAASDGDAGIEGVGGVDGMGGLRRAERPDRPHPAPGLELADRLLGEDPAVAGVADRVDHGRPTAMWSAWLRLRPPQVSRKLPVTTTSGRCRRTSAASSRRIAHAVLQDAVGLVQEVHGRRRRRPGPTRPARPRAPRGARPAPCRRCRPRRW